MVTHAPTKPANKRTTGKGRASPEDRVIAAIRRALLEEDYLAARELANKGAADYPEHEQLRKWAIMMAPPRIISTDRPPDPTMARNREWMRHSSGPYKGKWVAVYNGELVGAGDTVREIMANYDVPKGSLLAKVV